MLGFVSAHSSWNVLSNLELQRSYSVFCRKLVLPSTNTPSNICQRAYWPTVDAMKKQLPSRNEVSLDFDRWTSTKNWAITSPIAYYLDRNWVLREVQLTFNVVDSPFFSSFKSYLRILGQGSTYWSKASHTFEGSSRLVWDYWRPFPWNHNWKCILKVLNDKGATIDPWGQWNRLPCNTEPYTLHGASHLACFGFIHQQSLCEMPHQVFVSSWGRSAIWREWPQSLGRVKVCEIRAMLESTSCQLWDQI